jgi:hypothetical protein
LIGEREKKVKQRKEKREGRREGGKKEEREKQKKVMVNLKTRHKMLEKVAGITNLFL